MIITWNWIQLLSMDKELGMFFSWCRLDLIINYDVDHTALSINLLSTSLYILTLTDFPKKGSRLYKSCILYIYSRRHFWRSPCIRKSSCIGNRRDGLRFSTELSKHWPSSFEYVDVWWKWGPEMSSQACSLLL